MERSYYNELYLHKECTVADIKQQYYKLAYEYHPDRENGDSQKFLNIQKAYVCLKDKYRRGFYDAFGSKGFKLTKNENLELLLTRLFYKKGLFIFILLLITMLTSLYLIPILIFVNKYELAALNFSFYYIPFAIVVSILLLSVLKTLIQLIIQKENCIKEIRYFLMFIVKIFLLILQALIMNLLLDNILNIKRIYWLSPCFFLELINIVQDIFLIKREYPEDRKKVGIKLFFLFLIRLSFFLIFITRISSELKVCITLIISMAGFIYGQHSHNIKVKILLIVIISCYVLGSICLGNWKIDIVLKMLLLVPFGILMVTMIKGITNHMKQLPTSLFLKQKMLCF
jgi:hypothetical protein